MINENKSGFSLIELMVALGVAVVVSFGTVTIIQNIRKSAKNSEISGEVNSVTNSITQILLNKVACTNTFKNLGPIKNSLSVDQIKNSLDKTVFNTTAKYGNNLLKISEMKVTDVTFKTPEPGFTKKLGEFTLHISMEKIGTKYDGKKYILKDLTLNGEFDLADNLLNCYWDTEDTVVTAPKNSCENIGGTWDALNQKCTLSNLIDKSNALSTEFLKDRLDDLVNNFLPTTYVKKAGDSMSGPLIINGANLSAVDVRATNNLIATNKVCVGTRCQNFSQVVCNKDSNTVGILEDGTLICSPMVCPADSYIQKLDAGSGTIVCKVLPNRTCAANQYVSEVRPDGSITCLPLPLENDRICSKGQYVKTIDPNGNITCENPNISINCPNNQYVFGFDFNGKALCKTKP